MRSLAIEMVNNDTSIKPGICTDDTIPMERKDTELDTLNHPKKPDVGNLESQLLEAPVELSNDNNAHHPINPNHAHVICNSDSSVLTHKNDEALDARVEETTPDGNAEAVISSGSVESGVRESHGLDSAGISQNNVVARSHDFSEERSSISDMGSCPSETATHNSDARSELYLVHIAESQDQNTIQALYNSDSTSEVSDQVPVANQIISLEPSDTQENINVEVLSVTEIPNVVSIPISGSEQTSDTEGEDYVGNHGSSDERFTVEIGAYLAPESDSIVPLNLDGDAIDEVEPSILQEVVRDELLEQTFDHNTTNCEPISAFSPRETNPWAYPWVNLWTRETYEELPAQVNAASNISDNERESNRMEQYVIRTPTDIEAPSGSVLANPWETENVLNGEADEELPAQVHAASSTVDNNEREGNHLEQYVIATPTHIEASSSRLLASHWETENILNGEADEELLAQVQAASSTVDNNESEDNYMQQDVIMATAQINTASESAVYTEVNNASQHAEIKVTPFHPLPLFEYSWENFFSKAVYFTSKQFDQKVAKLFIQLFYKCDPKCFKYRSNCLSKYETHLLDNSKISTTTDFRHLQLIADDPQEDLHLRLYAMYIHAKLLVRNCDYRKALSTYQDIIQLHSSVSTSQDHIDKLQSRLNEGSTTWNDEFFAKMQTHLILSAAVRFIFDCQESLQMSTTTNFKEQIKRIQLALQNPLCGGNIDKQVLLRVMSMPVDLTLSCAICHKKTVEKAANNKSLKFKGTLKKCSQCWRVAYCSVTCQRKHWKKGGHRLVCRKQCDFKIGDVVMLEGIERRKHTINGEVGYVMKKFVTEDGVPMLRVASLFIGQGSGDITAKAENMVLLIPVEEL
ncbi:hypothetical protein HDU76_007147 [Blyttiomyces sp. JEL0837]|nr:hypothetical protein HDU76_007147 [Blyttiomyces sp. JEL0837]